MLIRVNEIKDSMVLARDVRDVNGRFLCARGTQLSPKHIRVFKMWGILTVDVTDEPGSETPDRVEENLAAPAEDRKLAERAFRRAGTGHPAMRELVRLSARYGNKEAFPDDHKPLPEGDEDVVTAEVHIRRRCEQIIQGDIELPEIPSIVYELNEVIADPLSSSDQIAQVVNKSPALAARLLTIVNSPFYSFPRRIDSISRAVTMIGTREIATLAIGISIISVFKEIPQTLFEMRSFLRHSFSCGLISRILGAYKNLPQTEQLFVSGLLHDIGRLIFYQYFPDVSRRLLNRSLRNGELLYRTEQEMLGMTHSRVAELLIRKWRLPLTLENDIVFHHRPSLADQVVPAAIVHVADIMTNALRLGSSGERLVPDLDSGAWDLLGLTPGCFEPTARQAVHQLAELETLLT
jgi:HD-like signal output (HDOD) protein